MRLILRKLEIFGKYDEGDFEGSISFQDGVTVINGNNGFGKSLVISGIGWCLGLERMSVIADGDSSYFTEGVRSKIEINGKKGHKIISSVARLELETDENLKIVLTRPIHNGNTREIEFELIENGKKREGKFAVGSGSFQNPSTGFQSNLFKILGWQTAKTMKTDGNQSTLYWENLGSLFFIEQLGGWTDIQAQQIKRYGILEVNQYSFEYVLGLKNEFNKRFTSHAMKAKENEFRATVNSLFNEVNNLIKDTGTTNFLSTKGKAIESLYKELSQFNIFDYVRSEVNWDFDKEILDYKKKISIVEDQIRKSGEETLPDGYKDAAANLVKLRESAITLEKNISTLTIQLVEESNVLHDYQHKIASSNDLLKFKIRKLGFADAKHECPTCQQQINLEAYNIKNLSSEELQSYADAAQKERKALENSISKTRAELARLKNDKMQIDRQIYSLEENLKFLSGISNKSKSELINILGKRTEYENAIKDQRKRKDDATIIQGRIQQTLREVEDFFSSKSQGTEGLSDKKILSGFLKQYIEMLKKIDLSIFASDPQNVEKVTLDEYYNPVFEGRELRNLASASDQARIIMPYVIALQKSALTNGGCHPGFLILDEPLQQNPDEKRRPSMVSFIASLPKSSSGQILIFSSLKKDELEQLKSSVNTNQLTESRFLNQKKEIV